MSGYPTQSDGAIELPDAEQRAALAQIVIGRYKFLGPDVSGRWAESNRADWERQFESSLLTVAAFGRGEVDTKTAIQAWIDRAEDYLRSRPVAPPTTTLALPAFMAACLVMGVKHTLDPRHWPYDLNLNLCAEGMGTKASSSSWKSVLGTKRLPEATVIPSTKRTDASPSQVRST